VAVEEAAEAPVWAAAEVVVAVEEEAVASVWAAVVVVAVVASALLLKDKPVRRRSTRP